MKVPKTNTKIQARKYILGLQGVHTELSRMCEIIPCVFVLFCSLRTGGGSAGFHSDLKNPETFAHGVAFGQHRGSNRIQVQLKCQSPNSANWTHLFGNKLHGFAFLLSSLPKILWRKQLAYRHKEVSPSHTARKWLAGSKKSEPGTSCQYRSRACHQDRDLCSVLWLLVLAPEQREHQTLGHKSCWGLVKAEVLIIGSGNKLLFRAKTSEGCHLGGNSWSPHWRLTVGVYQP